MHAASTSAANVQPRDADATVCARAAMDLVVAGGRVDNFADGGPKHPREPE